LLRHIRAGSRDAATELYLRYADRLRYLALAESSPDLARKEDPEDIVQSVFTSFFRGVGLGYYTVPAGEELWKLLLVIALNKIRAKGAFHRAAKRDVRRTLGSEFLDKVGLSLVTADETAVVIIQLVIDETLADMPEPQQEMVRLRIEGYEVAEIAERTQRSKRTVERVLQEFRAKLARLLDCDQQ
jgi:RNA polymerase sigma-70 factor (ECF subfamily)